MFSFRKDRPRKLRRSFLCGSFFAPKRRRRGRESEGERGRGPWWGIAREGVSANCEEVPAAQRQPLTRTERAEDFIFTHSHGYAHLLCAPVCASVCMCVCVCASLRGR